jgi:hypothetical protein
MHASLISLKAATPETLPWTWDPRYNTVVQILKETDATSIQPRIAEHLPTPWSNQTTPPLPPQITSLIRNLSGLKDDQILYTGSPTSADLLFAAFWPWSDHLHVSLRVGVYSPHSGKKPFPSWLRPIASQIFSLSP